LLASIHRTDDDRRFGVDSFSFCKMCFLALHAIHLWRSEDCHIYSMLTCLMDRSSDRVTLPGYMEHSRDPHPPFSTLSDDDETESETDSIVIDIDE
jgi:hypothetical protein